MTPKWQSNAKLILIHKHVVIINANLKRNVLVTNEHVNNDDAD